MYAEVVIDDSLVMITAAESGMAPRPCSLGIYADDVDDAYARALAEGARSLQAPNDQFYGHRTASIEDPQGNLWTIHTIIENLSDEELVGRAARIASRRN